MRRTTVEAEISATSYKKLCERLRKMNRKGLWNMLDHYIFHIMEDGHVTELLQILDNLDKGTQEKRLAVHALAEEGFTLAPEHGSSGGDKRYYYTDVVASQDLEDNKDRLDLMFDNAYFTYLHPSIVAETANKLVAFANMEKLPVAPHWHLYAEQPDLASAEDDDDDDGGEDDEE